VSTKASTLLLFGATGDLAKRMLLPSLFGLDRDKLLPRGLRIVGTARSERDTGSFRDHARGAVQDHVPEDYVSPEDLDRFLDRLTYVQLDANDPAGFNRLAAEVGDSAGEIAIFLSTAPSLFRPTIENLQAAGLAGAHVRMALEKPLGNDLASSREINDAVATAFPEERTFRIDHYLGKETVQNLLALRFANLLFEPLWNARHIAHVQITVAETIGLEGRGDYYDSTGALRDMVQNHMLQLLALVAMEPPSSFDAAAVRDEKVKVLRSLRPLTAATAADHVVVGQYDEGSTGDCPVRGYAEELGKTSTTETSVAIKAHVDNWRWAGVPFYLRTGKRLAERKTEIVVEFRNVPHSMFAEPGASTRPNRLIIAIQPEENISLEMMAKVPGLDRGGIRLREVSLDIDQPHAFSDVRRRIAYERLLLDLIEGDPTLFVRRDEVEAQWQWIDGVRQSWQEGGLVPQPYPSGSWGPAAAEALIGGDGGRWND